MPLVILYYKSGLYGKGAVKKVKIIIKNYLKKTKKCIIIIVVRYILFKSLLSSVLCIIMAFCVCACLEPILVKEFLENPEIQDMIKVKLQYFPSDIKAGNQKITGLNLEKYYLVETLNETGSSNDPRNFKFVKTDGTLGGLLSDVNKVTGGEVKGLNNKLFYSIWEAAPLKGEFLVYNLDGDEVPDGTPSEEYVIEDEDIVLNLPAPILENYYLDLSQFFTSEPQVVKRGINSATVEFLTNADSDYIIKLEGEGTTTEYIFYDAANPPVEKDSKSFKVLKVAIGSKGELILSILFDIKDGKAKLNPSTLTFSQSDLNIKTINIENFNDFSSLEWIVGGDENTAITSNSFSIDFNENSSYNNGLNAKGKHYITVVGIINTVPYSAILEIVIED